MAQGLIQLNYKLQAKYGRWEINDAMNNTAQSSTGSVSHLLDEARSCSEEDLRLAINQISWQLDNVIQCATLAIHQFFYYRRKEDKFQSVVRMIDDSAQYYQKTLEVQPPTVDEKTIAEYQIKVIKRISALEGLLCDPHSFVFEMLNQKPYAYAEALKHTLRDMRACQYEVSVLYASDKKLIFDVNAIVDNLDVLIGQMNATISSAMSLQPELMIYLQKNGIDMHSAYLLDPELINLVEAFLKKKTPYEKAQLLADGILEIIRSDEFRKRLDLIDDKADSAAE